MVDLPPADSDRTRETPPPPPEWLPPYVRSLIWRIVLVGLFVALLLILAGRVRGLISMLIVAMFFGIAMEPAVNRLHTNRGMKRGAATGLVFGVVVVFVIVLIAILIPGLVSVADSLRDTAAKAAPTLNDLLGVNLPTSKTDPAYNEFKTAVENWIQSHAGDIVGLASNTVGLVFQVFTIGMFAFYFAADAPRIRRSVLRRFPPNIQQRLGWSWDTAIEQTGGYLYSRFILMVINGGLFFFAMVLVGVDVSLALPLAIFEGFVAEFIPAVGTYIGAAVPIIITLGVVGVTAAAILLVWTLIYQQIENYWLSPKISAKTMEINGGVAFGAAIAGGSIGGPMGAFMALPIAALITSFLKNFGRRYPLVYVSPYDGQYQDEVDENLAQQAQAADDLAKGQG